MLRTIRDFWHDQSGQGLVEYALVVAIASVLSLATLKFLGQIANNVLQKMGV